MARQIVVHLSEDLSDTDHADLANAIWAVAVPAEAVEIIAPDIDEVHREMERLWSEAPRLTASGYWRRPSSR